MSNKKKTSGNERTYNVSSVVTNLGNELTKKRKVNKGKIWIELCYYKLSEYRKVNGSQIEELCQWRKDNGLVKLKEGNPRNNMKDQVIAAIKKILKQTAEKDKEEEIIKHLIASISTNNKWESSSQ